MEERFEFLKKNRGFTLTELIVVIAVSAVLLSVSVAGIVAWVHHADFVRNENYAETIYYAAQSELTRYRANGQLKELEEIVRKENTDIAGKVPQEAGAEIGAEYADRLYYMKKDQGTADINTPLGGLLADYIYDGSIMEGAVCIEFDPVDGTVYSVSYSDRNERLVYKAPEETDRKEASLISRSKEIRKKERMGYYSVELSEAAPGAVGKTRLEHVELVNEEQLYLRWSLPEKYSAIRGFLSYTIEIYDKNSGDNKPEYTFVIKGNKLREADASLHIKDADGNIVPEYLVECTGKNGADEDIRHEFIAYNSGEEMYLLLDSIDYGADPGMITKDTTVVLTDVFRTDAFKNSASILQLFSEPEDIYIRMQAQGKPYKTSAWKQSNTSNTMFASMEEGAGTAADIYEIKNIRHLYNIRYRERENSLIGSSAKEICYRQTANIAWPSADDRLFHSTSSAGAGTSGMKIGSLQETDKCVPVTGSSTEKVPYFPEIPVLGGKSGLEVAAGKNCELKNFVLSEKDGGETGLAAGDEEQKLGLIAVNRGRIQGLILTNVSAQGVKNVGAVCGINEGRGKIWDTNVSGKVAGEENVGGVAGLDRTTLGIAAGEEPSPEELDKSPYKNLTNYAEVAGSNGKVGGIVGSLDEKGRIYLCENYGVAKGTESCTIYIGGIAGYSEGRVQNCISAPCDIPPAEDDNGTLEKVALKGIFVGGIVGCNNGGVIQDSGTAKETKNIDGTGSDACIAGYRYVGGIVGYNNCTVSGGNEGTLVNTSPGRTNKAKVIGHDYVGGIVGANGFLESPHGEIVIEETITEEKKKAFEDAEIKEEYSAKMVVENWINEGIVEAVASYSSTGSYDSDGFYAGGIAGYNAGDLKGCTTRINTSSSGASELIAQVRLYGKDASYVGGVAGYNVGHIYYQDAGAIRVNSVVSGKHYVGGIAGYNGTTEVVDGGSLQSGKIENYALSGGYISGESYVGGYVGLNTTENLFKDTILSSNPNEVTADYFAGGVMGALILAPGNNAEITIKCSTNNFFGSVEAENAFAGGYAGYTQLLKKGKDAKERAKDLYVKLTADGVKENINSEETGRRQEVLQVLVNKILDERMEDLDNTTAELQFVYEEGSVGESRLASVKAPVFAGGVIGANSWNTGLLLKNICNEVQVTAENSAIYDFISMSRNRKEGEDRQDTFSFSGGIIGLVTPETTVDSCSNSGAGSVEGKGTYSGGIAEVNLGTIRNCTAGSVSNRSYYGGIAGLNTNEGRIEGCELNGRINGESYLGGITVCNEGIIENCTVKDMGNESAVIGIGEYIGGIAAVNREKTREGNGAKKYENRIRYCSVQANIGAENMGKAVGGLLGRYEGGGLQGSVVLSEKIYGADCVGGIAGEIYAVLEGTTDSGGKEEVVTNHADISAALAAGGIGGVLKENAKVTGCRNMGKVTSARGIAGGIVPEIMGGTNSVENCQNSGSVEAPGGMAGGIAAKNNGVINRCTVWDGTAGAVITVRGIDAIGGIAGENRGEIENCILKGDVRVSDINVSGKERRMIGGIAGRNTGNISDSEAAENSGKRPEITTLSQESFLGGIAGTNMRDGTDSPASGKIERGKINLKVSAGMDKTGTVGGAVGANAGMITGITFSGVVEGTSGVQYGTGGIAGRNELESSTGSIEDCVLAGDAESTGTRGVVKGISGDTGFGGYYDQVRGAYVGGICGVNPENGMISGCKLQGGCSVSANYGYVGGIVAYNLGELKNNLSDPEGDGADAKARPGIYNSGDKGNGRCVIGGIAGFNGTFGILENCRTGRWTIENSMGSEVERYPTGGIIGCNKSVRDQRELVNYAAVTGNWMSGGIIGEQITELRGGFTIEKCENFGAVTGAVRAAGGIIADWRGSNGIVRECINRGTVSISNTVNGNSQLNGAGGIIGTGWWGTPVTIAIERCGNEGKIVHDAKNTRGNNGAAGGIFGVYNPGSAAFTLIITDCYNAAEIQNANDSNRVSAGIFAGDERGGTINATLTRCVNYGKGTYSDRPFAGIISRNYSGGTNIVRQCLNAGECSEKQNPVAYCGSARFEFQDNYYFSNTNGKEPGEANGIKVAERNFANGQFKAISEMGWWGEEIQVTRFDTDHERLYLPADSTGKERYIQFTDVEGTYKSPGPLSDIENLKVNFSACGYRKDHGTEDAYTLLLFGMDSGTFEAPESVDLEETEGIYKVTYKAHPDSIFCTAGYEVEIGVFDDAGKLTELLAKDQIGNAGINTWTIDADTLFEGKDRTKYSRIQARVRAAKADGYGGIVAPVKENGKEYSNWKVSDPLETKSKLPTPQIHFEVSKDGRSDQICGYWVLDNASDYEAYGSEWEIELKNVDDDAGSPGILSDGKRRTGLMTYSNRGLSSGGTSTVTLTACAKPVDAATDRYRKSDDLVKMFSFYAKQGTLKAELARADQIGEFIGTVSDELGYRFRLKQSGSNYQYTNITCMAEFWLGGEKLGESTVLLPNMQGEEYCTIDLSSVDQGTIREVMENISLGVSDRGKEVTLRFYPWEMEDFKYYITSDTTNEITSSTISEAVKSDQAAFNSSYVKIDLRSLKGYAMYPEPVPGDKVVTEMADDGSITHTLYWDAVERDGVIIPYAGDDYKDAEYVVTVTGKTGDTEIILFRNSEKDPIKDYSIRLEENNWKYEKLVLTVERLGKRDEAGGSCYIGASAEPKELSVPIRLSSVPKPDAKLRDRDGLIFDLNWVRSSESGVGGYEIVVRGKDEAGRDISPVRISAGDVGELEIDLDQYPDLKDAKEVTFSVIAVSNDSAKYLNSGESGSASMKIPDRLSEPGQTPELMRNDVPVDFAAALLPEEFAEFKLQITDNNAPADVDASYQIEYFVAGSEAEDGNGGLFVWDAAANGGAGGLTVWDENERPVADPEHGIYISAEPSEMDGNLQSAVYWMNEPPVRIFDAEQAGRTLRYRARAVSNSMISSEWTEWKSVKLPQVKLAAVEIPENQTMDREYHYTIDGNTTDIGTGTLYTLSVRQPRLGFEPVEFAKGYEIYIKGADRTEAVRQPDGTVREEIIPGEERSYILEKVEENPDGTSRERPFILKDGSGTVLDGQPDMPKEETADNGETVYSYMLYSVTYTYKLEENGREFIYAIPTDARLCYSVRAGKVSEIWLELPEGVALAADGGEISSRKFIGTSMVDIKVEAPDKERYLVEELTRWQRDPADETVITISRVDVNTALGSRTAVLGYFEDTLSTNDLSDLTLKLFGLKRTASEVLPEEELLPEEEKDRKEERPDVGEKDVSGNDITIRNGTMSGDDVAESSE